MRLFQKRRGTAYSSKDIFNMMSNDCIPLLIPSNSSRLGAMYDLPTLRLSKEAVRHRILHNKPSTALVEADSLRNFRIYCFPIKRNGSKNIEAIQRP